ncbi:MULTISPECIES: 50S ribosomal protein L35 [Paenibacillus]|jgi:large subunit ribosomal protein L35|uniref:Large ribosomal subunit protein bL35 n=1 Tax=Paenibacillus catalpae TaxID=1045775 RepID=A0A1I2AJ95_9BACL|nr:MULTISPECIES: 50S ribosomal protein L35 [Paenibacillus]NIK26349.1 large subunit ribosomal protein L35 [Paenibacillus lupini]NIK66721.1 large subunit ribosomal protein L35 [Paenibacillus sp. BK720]TCN00700.1 LSU ribosomal protein L35P [Paenibacillus sp. BK033]SFE43859.1 large subunit ribosomal protein L35 [Paenibacillus catalpae]GFN31083.1 50S ribosomal protein L35 [Paenibacillus curdlanolyticus]
MPKMKTHSSLKDRFKITGTGKVKRYKAFRNHLLSHKSGRQKRVLAGQPLMAAGDVRRIQQGLANLK